VLTDVAHSIGVYLFRVGQFVNPDRLRHVVLQVQAPLWHTCRRANSCSQGQVCSVGNRASKLTPNLALTSKRPVELPASTIPTDDLGARLTNM
jgi:hypothetical protein